jgi:hypothetical protein
MVTVSQRPLHRIHTIGPKRPLAATKVGWGSSPTIRKVGTESQPTCIALGAQMLQGKARTRSWAAPDMGPSVIPPYDPTGGLTIRPTESKRLTIRACGNVRSGGVTTEQSIGPRRPRSDMPRDTGRPSQVPRRQRR